MNAVTQAMGLCPCKLTPDGLGCSAIGIKLTRYGHLVGCGCRPCMGRRNRRKGQATEAKRHRRLGGEGRTPRDELAFSYSVNITTEDKGGAQIPGNFTRFIGAKWTKDALRQAEKKVPVGSDALPTLWLDCGHAGTWIVARVPKKGLR